MTVSIYMAPSPWQNPGLPTTPAPFAPAPFAPPQYTAPPGWPFIVQGPSRAEHDALVHRVAFLEMALSGSKPKAKAKRRRKR